MGDSGGWSEDDSDTFLDHGAVFVPARAAQIAAVAAVVPTPPAGALALDLCCGEGLLSHALLARHPTLAVIGYDGSPVMRTQAAITNAAFGPRFSARAFDLAAADWRRAHRPLHAVVSSLAIHHLDGDGKRRLFADVARALAPGGAFVIADLVLPATAEGRAYAARAWDDAVRTRADDETFALFQRERWNFYDDPTPDPIDQPSPLADQLRWLAEAGLVDVDVHWMAAGHAVFSARRPA